MSTLLERRSGALVPAEAVPELGIVLRQVPWSVYVTLRDAPDNDRLRMNYDRGRLELVAPARRHERPHRLLGRMVHAWTEERDISISSGGQTTLRREDLARGAEPDDSFHIQHEAEVRAVEDLVLPDHPPPDLIIEADSTHSSVPRLPIFAALGVPEVWRWTDGALHVLQLEGNDYIERAESRVLPGFPFDEACRLITVRSSMSETALMKAFRDFVRNATGGRTAAEEAG